MRIVSRVLRFNLKFDSLFLSVFILLRPVSRRRARQLRNPHDLPSEEDTMRAHIDIGSAVVQGVRPGTKREPHGYRFRCVVVFIRHSGLMFEPVITALMMRETDSEMTVNLRVR